jgi:hypothetical protein
MHRKKRHILATIVLFLMTFSLMLAACANGSTQASDATNVPISAENDSAVFSDQGFIADPEAGLTIGELTSGGVPFDSLGLAATPDSYTPPGDLNGLTVGIPVGIPHGDTTGDDCMTCHETGAGGVPQMEESHLAAGFDSTYCRNCHQNA